MSGPITSNDSSAFQKLQKQLIDAGFEESFVTEGDSPMGAYEGHGYGVIISADTNDGETTVGYVVSEVETD